MNYGYARVSSDGQDLTQQFGQLEAAACTKIDREKIGGGTAQRPQLKRRIGALDAGDMLMATSTDRLAYDMRDLLNILHTVNAAVAGFRLIARPMVDTTSQLADASIAVQGVAGSDERHRINRTHRAPAVPTQGKSISDLAAA